MTIKDFTAGDTLTAADMDLYCSHTGGAWDTFTPTRTNLTIGNGTEVSRYFVAPRLVVWRYVLTFGSTTSISGDVSFSLPVDAASGSAEGAASAVLTLVDEGTTSYLGHVRIGSTTTAQLRVWRADSTYVSLSALSSTVPHTWATTDKIRFTLAYEGAS